MLSLLLPPNDWPSGLSCYGPQGVVNSHSSIKIITTAQIKLWRFDSKYSAAKLWEQAPVTSWQQQDFHRCDEITLLQHTKIVIGQRYSSTLALAGLCAAEDKKENVLQGSLH